MYVNFGEIYTVEKFDVEGRSVRVLVSPDNLTLITRDEVKKWIDDLTFFYDNTSDGFIDEYNRTKKEWVREEWRRFNEGYYDIPRSPKAVEDVGFVYLMKEEFSDTFKIGKTKDVKNRSSAFGVTLPFDWHYVVIFESDESSLLEELLHDKFNHCRARGEWFDLTDADVQSFEGSFKESEEIHKLIKGVYDHEGR